jgi:Tol biopolymer transport system component
VSPDAQHIAYLESLPSKVIRIIDADGSNPRSLAQVERDDSFWEIAWSPKGRWLLAGRWGGAISSYDTVLEAIDVASGKVRPVMSDPRFFQNWRAFLSLAWLPDGRLVFARRETPPNVMSSNLWQVELDGETARPRGSPTRLTQFTGVNLKDLSFTSDGHRLSFLQERNQNDVLVADLRQEGSLANVPNVVADDREDRPLGFSPDNETLYFESTRSGAWGIYRMGLRQGSPELLAKMRTESPFSFEVSGDGRSILGLRRQSESHLLM